MKLFLDCEFNGFGGELISLALVAENAAENYDYFYEVLNCHNPVPWVAEHVLPRLNQTPIDINTFQKRLQLFLLQYDHLEIIADWPEDFSLFTRSLVLSAGKCMTTPPITLRLWMNEPTESHIPSANPHNALSDAQALKASYLDTLKNSE